MAKKPTPLEKTSSSLFDNLGNEDALSLNEDRTLVSAGKKSVSAWAIVAFVFGGLGFFSLLHLGFLVFSAAGLFASFVAFYLIARSAGELEGKIFASLGLILTIGAAIAGPYSAHVYKLDFNRQADEFVKLWFENVKSDNVALAHQQATPYWQRAAFVTKDDVLKYWKQKARGEEEEQHGVYGYLSNPTLLTIHRLGDRAKISYDSTFWRSLTSGSEQTERVYAVTVEPEDPNGKTQTFFLPFVLERVMRQTPEGKKLIGWTIRISDLTPLKLDAAGRPIRPE